MRGYQAVVVAVAVVASFASATAAEKKSEADRRIEIAKKLSGVKPEDIRTTPIAGLYEVRTVQSSGFVTADGEFLIRGELFNVKTRQNLTQESRKQDRIRTLAELDERQLIIFSPEHPKHTVTVFTDVDCSYCRKLHGEMAQLNELGIRVRYVAYPRGGPGTDAWKTMESVWCSADRNDAITRAKRGEKVTASCDANPVAAQYAAGGKLGMSGTPGIYDEDGTMLGGYVPAKQLAAMLDRSKAAADAVKSAALEGRK